MLTIKSIFINYTKNNVNIYKSLDSILYIMEKVSYKYVILLLLIILLGLAAKYVIINYEWIDTDEGNYLYDAKLLLEGARPFEDFYLKDVMYISILALFGKIFGFSLLIGRLLSMVFSLVTAIFLYKIGSMLHDKKIGLIACIIYIFMPFTLFWDGLIREYTLLMMLVSIAIYYAIKFTRTEKPAYMLVNSFFMFLALLTRRSVALLIIMELILLAYMYRHRLNFLLKAFIYGLIGMIIPLILLFIYSYLLDASFMKMLGFEFTPYIEIFSWQQFLGLRAVLPYWLFREASFIMALCMIVLAYNSNKNMKKIMLFGVLFLVITSEIIFWYLITVFPERMSQYPITSEWFLLIGLFYAILLFVLAYYESNSNLTKHRQNGFIIIWFFSIIAFYFFYPRWHVVYFMELMPAAVIMVAPLLKDLFENKTYLNRIFLFVLLIGIVLSTIFYADYHGISNKWSPKDANEIASYIKENSNPNDEIFTPLTFIPIMAERRLALNISHPLFYHFKGAGDEDKVGVPSFNTIIDYLERNNVKYVVANNQMDVTYYALKPDIKTYIENNYILEKKIGDTEILARKAD